MDGPGGDFLMSPYSWRTFQLVEAKDGGIGFLDLKEFEDKENLKLDRLGVHSDEKKVSQNYLRELKLPDYFEVYDSDRKGNSANELCFVT